jgi:hypothetical protein
MGAIDEAIEVVRAAEQKLRRLIVQAVEQADYGHLSLLAEWAKQLNAILGADAPSKASLDAAREPGPTVADHTGNGTDHPAAPPRGRAGRSATRTAIGVGHDGNVRNRKGKKPGYPKFLREGELLVKVGWSRREKQPYEHKAPRSVVSALVQALLRVGAGGKRFTTESLFPLKEPGDGSEIPVYQAYVTLALLRANGLIVQHGRQGYSLREEKDLTAAVDRLWNHLPAR